MFFVLFFISGTASLICEIIWIRLFVLIFGNTTYTLVVVIGAFLLGLAIGSLFFGYFTNFIPAKRLLKIYSLLELLVGLGGIFVLQTIPWIRNMSGELIYIKFFLSAIVIVIPTFLMGGTLPVLLKALKTQQNSSLVVSYLYGINTVGGVIGVLLAGFVLIELFGLTGSTLIASLLNISIALIAWILPFSPKSITQKFNKQKLSFSKQDIFILVSFFLSGLLSISYQVLWTRILTPSLGTLTYAFACQLAFYLLGIGIGSLLYKRFLSQAKDNYMMFGFSQLGIGVFALLGVIFCHFVNFGISEVIVRVALPTICMGLTFPCVVAILSKGASETTSVGVSYFLNILGAICGSFLVSFVFIPNIGTSRSIILLSVGNMLLALVFLFFRAIYKTAKVKQLISRVNLGFIVLGIVCLIFGQYLLPFKLASEIVSKQRNNSEYVVKEDEVASIFAYNDKVTQQSELVIDGFSTTSNTAETRIMTHLPIALHSNPKKILIIAFGMGTAYRSALKHDIPTDVVELVPSVPSVMNIFHYDAAKWLDSSIGNIIINDGRNYVYLTKNKYDIVIIDPPPPFYAAGSSVLYSEEFYQDIQKLLNDGGIVNQWVYYDGAQSEDVAMAIKSFSNVFPYVSMFNNKKGVGGFYLDGSFGPIDATRIRKMYDDPIAMKDLEEVKNNGRGVEFIADQKMLSKSLENLPSITDDFPRNEYFLIRHLIYNLNPNKKGTNSIEEFVNQFQSK